MRSALMKFVAPEFIFGVGARYLLLQYIRNFGIVKPFVVSDDRVTRQQWYKEMVEEMSDTHIDFVTYREVTINPKDYECSRGAQLYMENQCDAVIAIGGGSVLDCAKGIGILVSNGGEVEDYEGVDKILIPIPPLICVPTTSGSSADVSQFAILTNTKEHYKMAHVSKMLVPDVSLIDPEVTLTMPDKVTIDTALDTLVHAIESYVSPLATFMTEPRSLSAIDTVVKFLPMLIGDFDNLEYRSELSRASLEAGIAFSNASLGLVHAIAHSVGGYFVELEHGELNGTFLKHVVAYNYTATDKYQKVEEIFARNHPQYAGMKLPEILKDFVSRVNAPVLEALKVTSVNDSMTDADIGRIAVRVLNDPCVLTNPREPVMDEVVEILEKVFKRRD